MTLLLMEKMKDSVSFWVKTLAHNMNFWGQQFTGQETDKFCQCMGPETKPLCAFWLIILLGFWSIKQEKSVIPRI